MNNATIEYLINHFNDKLKELLDLEEKAHRARKIENKINIYKNIYKESSKLKRVIEDIFNTNIENEEARELIDFQITTLEYLKKDSLSIIDSLSELL